MVRSTLQLPDLLSEVRSWLSPLSSLPSEYASDVADVDGDGSQPGEVESGGDVEGPVATPNTSWARLSAVTHNQQLPVNRLPIEMLQTIFSLYADSEPDWRIVPVLIVSHTCSHWRAVSLGYPALWTTFMIGAMSLPLVQLFVERAGPHPIALISLGAEVNRKVWSWVCDNMHRAESVSMDVDNEGAAMDLVRGDTPFGGGRLATARLRFRYYRRASARDCIVPIRIFGTAAPDLRRMKLERIRMPWNSGLYVGLSTLVIRGCAAGIQHSADVDICLALRDCPRLEVLSLHLQAGRDWKHTRDPLLLARRCSLIFPLLHTMVLDMPLHYTRYLLSSVEASALRILEIVARKVPYDDTSTLLNIFQPALLPRHLVSSLRSFSIHVNTYMNVWRSFGIHAKGNTAKGQKTTLRLQVEDKEALSLSDAAVRFPLLGSMTQSLRAHYALPLLRDLDLVCDTATPEAGFCSDLMQYSTLQSLSVRGRGALKVLSAALDADVSASTTAWPHMRRLVVHGTKLTYNEACVVLRWCRARRTDPFSLSLLNSAITVPDFDSADRLQGLVRDVKELGVTVNHFDYDFLLGPNPQ